MAQYVRFGYLGALPGNYKEIADKLVMDDLYAEVAKSMNIAVPADDMKPFKLNIETVPFDPNNPKAYIAASPK
jgi:nitrate/nitrite transport system substrate-binding protein